MGRKPPPPLDDEPEVLSEVKPVSVAVPVAPPVAAPPAPGAALSVYDKLKIVRTKHDIVLPSAPNFRATLKKRDGTEVPLTLRDYQTQMVVHLVSMNRFVVGDDTGLGKTIETIAALCQLWRRDPNIKVLVLTKKSSVTQWDDEFTRFTTGVKVFVADGGVTARAKLQSDWAKASGPCVLIQGYSSACNDLSKMQGWKNYILICDEATVFKSPTTRVHKVCKHYSSQASRCWGLTATLIKNNLTEGYGIYKVVCPDLFQMTPTAFVSNFCIVQMQKIAGGRQVPVVVGYRDSDIARFREIIDPVYLGRPKHAVAADLPVLTTRDIFVGMTKFQEEKYIEAEAGVLMHGGGEEKETTSLTALIYCQEIVNHPGLIEFPTYNSEKLDALVEILSGEGEFEGKKVIVFTRFSKMVDIAIPVLAKAGIKSVKVTGGEDGKQRKKAMDDFQDPDSGVQVIWITMAGGDAINLQAAECIIFYDTPWSAGDYIQILGRMIRIGSIHSWVYAIHLVVRDTIDEHVQGVRRKKMGLIEKVLGERVKGVIAADTVHGVTSETKDLMDAMIAGAKKRRKKALPNLDL